MYRRIAEGVARDGSEVGSFAFERNLPRTLGSYLTTAEAAAVPALRAWSVSWSYKAFLTRNAETRRLVEAAFRGSKDTQEKWLKFVGIRRRLSLILNTAPAPSDGKTPEEIKKIRVEREKLVAGLTEEQEALERDLVKLIPKLEQDKELAGLGPKDLAPLLPDNAAFVDLVRYHDFTNARKPVEKYLAFVLLRDGTAHRVDLKEAVTIDEAITDWVSLIQTVLPADAPEKAVREHEQRLARAGLEVRERVWDPVAAKLPKGTSLVYLSPDGALHQLPWGALPGDQPETVLLERYVFATVPHGPYLLKRLKAPAEGPVKPRAVLAVGGVRYDQIPKDVPQAAFESKLLAEFKPRGKPWKYLDGSERELKLFANLDAKKFQIKSLSAVGASTTSVATALPSADIAHLATHGFFNKNLFDEERKRSADRIRSWEPERMGDDRGLHGQGVLNPLMFAGLALAGADKPDESGPDGGVLTADAVRRLDLDRMELAVLSSCKTGLGVRSDGQCVFTLQQAFHMAGCRNVVASLWDLPDEVTVALMAIFYKEVLEDGRSPLEALRKAQLFVYHNPDKIQGIYETYARGGPLPEVVATVPKGEMVPQLGARGKKAPTRLWAGLVLSGFGR